MANKTANELFDSETEFDDLLLTAGQCAETDWEEGFVTDMKSRFERFGMMVYISEKQLDTLNKIAGG